MREPVFLKTVREGSEEKGLEEARRILQECTLCPRQCGVDRTGGETGFCGAGMKLDVSSANEHHGEEPPISGRAGSGTIFLAHCNLKCIFCQNYPISHLGNSKEVSCEGMAKTMLSLQKRGCHNINFVTPTHYMPQILDAIILAVEMGLKIPIVYNCGGYESLRAIKLLEGIVDIYMPDFKYYSSELSEKYSGAADYFEKAGEAIMEMHRQVGELEVDEDGIAVRGVLIRHLVLPSAVEDSRKVFEFIAEKISKDSYVSIMAQYFPAFRAGEYGEIAHRLSAGEYSEAVEAAEELGLTRGWVQGEFIQRL